MLYLNCPAAPEGLCAVVPFGKSIASVAVPASIATEGEAVLTPILLLVVSTFKTFVSTVKSPVMANEDSVPTLVMFVCAAVDKVPAKLVAVSSPVEGLYVNPVSVSKPCVPVAPSTNTGNIVSSVLLFADMVTDVASAAVPVVSWLRVPTVKSNVLSESS